MKELFFQTPLCSTGYGITGQNLYKELRQSDIDISLYPLGNINCEDPELQQLAMNDWYRKKIGLSYDSPTLRLWHQFSSERVGSGPLYHFPIFELDEFNDQEKYTLGFADKIICCSKWAKEVCINNGFKEENIFVCPLGTDQKLFRPRICYASTSKYVFAAAGKISLNKGYDVLADIFNKAFTPKDDVELWIFGHNPFLSDDLRTKWVKHFKDSVMGNHIKFFPPFKTQSELAQNLIKADAFIAPNRAEGFNLPLLDAISMGLPAIATNYSGHTEFLTKDNAFLVDITKKEVAYDGQFFVSNIGNWAKIGPQQIDQFVDYMRYCYNNRISNNPEGIRTSALFSWKNSANILKNIIFGD